MPSCQSQLRWVLGSSAADALEELRRCAGTQFDPAVVEVVAAVVTSTAGELDSTAAATLVSVLTRQVREATAAVSPELVDLRKPA